MQSSKRYGRSGHLIGKKARLHQTWSIAGLIAAKELMSNPAHLNLITFQLRTSFSELVTFESHSLSTLKIVQFTISLTQHI
ncbi:glycoside hydrolase 100 family protein [Phormidesmis sp. 146-12]